MPATGISDPTILPYPSLIECFPTLGGNSPPIKDGFLVVIDGPVGAGKGTMSKAAQTLCGFSYLDTGLLYRGAGYLQGQYPEKTPEEVAKMVTGEFLDQTPESLLRTVEVAAAASIMGRNLAVRKILDKYQEDFAKKPNGVIMDGRHMGKLFPDADLKIYCMAGVQLRINRRFAQLKATGAPVTTREDLEAAILARDGRDGYLVIPEEYKPGSDMTNTYVMETDNMSQREQIFTFLKVISEKGGFGDYIFEAPVDDITPREMPNGEIADITPREMPNGEIADITPREMPNGEIADDTPREMPNGEIADDTPREMPNGEIADGEIADVTPRETIKRKIEDVDPEDTPIEETRSSKKIKV